MAQLSWGKPTIEFGKCVNGATPSEWTKLGCDPVESSTKLTPTKGEKKEAKVEGGENEGREKPIKDSDGVVEGEYAFRLTPEDETCEGILIERSVVSVEESYDTAEGKKWKYTVDVLKPATGDQVKPYTPATPAE